MLVTERLWSHIAQSYRALATAIDEGIALARVELGSRDHLRQLLHVRRLDVDDI